MLNEHFFMCLLAICMYVFFGEMFKVFAHFLVRLFVFLALSCKSCLYILEINPMSIVLFALTVFQRRQWHPTPVLLPRKSMDRGAW